MPARGLLAALLLLTVSLQSQTRLPIHVESLRYPPLARQARRRGLATHRLADDRMTLPQRPRTAFARARGGTPRPAPLD